MRSYAILPAAGRSLRMKRPKLLMSWRDGTVIDHVLKTWVAAGVDKVVLVVRGDDPELAARGRHAGADVVVADPPPEDMKASVGFGLRHVSDLFRPSPEDAWLLSPADTPTLEASIVRHLLRLHDPRSPAILVPTVGGRRGHPILLPWPLADEAHRLPDDAGVNRLLEQHAVKEIDWNEESILDDLDTPEDYRRLSGRCHAPPGTGTEE